MARPPSSSSLGFHVFAMAVALAATLASPARCATVTPRPAAPAEARLVPPQELTAASWEALPRLTDIRHDAARDLSSALLGSGSATIDLPWSIGVKGRRVSRLVVTPSSVTFVEPSVPQISIEGKAATGATADMPALTVDALPPGLVQLGPSSRVLVTVEPDGAAIRWAGVEVPGGIATVELLLDREGRVTVQHLHVPPSIIGYPVGIAGAPLYPMNATAQRVSLPGNPRVVLDPLPGATATPKRSDPPPPNCLPDPGTWCDRADGPGTSTVFLSEGFDDLNAASRGWSASGMWHPIADSMCPPGARWTPGGSEYFGKDIACLYDPFQSGSLLSPVIGPITLGSNFVFSSRLEYEGSPFDTATIDINGVPQWNMPDPGAMDPTLWYDLTLPPNPLDPWAGQFIQIGFTFQSDDSNEFLGWMVDDVIVWDPNVGNPDCIRRAGVGPYAPCSQRQATSWSFSESDFCKGCIYSFYVLVECGREMHLPLDDMEGADVQVTNVVDGSHPALRCINSNALADAAGTGAYRGSFLGAEGGGLLDCCPTPGPDIWYGPSFDETDTAGPGHVAWGLADGCPSVLVYDSSVPKNGLFTCSDLSGACGLLDRLSPGENQTMDCYIQDDTGLCGLYRVDVVSGGNAWTLFANCDGTNTPQFPIFDDCTEAWAAYNPLPELTVANLVVTGGCPDLTVDFDVINLGCADLASDATVRVVAAGADASCGLPDNVQDSTVTGPFPTGSPVHVTRNITAPCSPARVDVTADPLNTVQECTETPGAAACRADVGIDTVTSFTCGCTAQLIANAGGDRSTCPGQTVRLDASGSTITGCSTRPLYRWSTSTGTVVRDWSPVPTYDVIVPCPAGRSYTVDIQCEGETCTDSATVAISCVTITPDAGADQKACVGSPVTLDASASTVGNCAQPIYRFLDPLGNEIRGWSTDPTLTIPALTCDQSGDWIAEVGCQGETCTNYDQVNVQCVQVIASAGPNLNACEGVPVSITRASSVATGCSTVNYQWFDPGGNPVSGVQTDPDFTLTLNGCPGVATLFLVAACAEPGFETCGTFDSMDITCGNPGAPVPAATATCSGTDVQCGAAEAGVTYWWDADTSVDSSGDGDPANDHSLDACDGSIVLPPGSSSNARAWARDALGCLSFTDVVLTSLAAPATPTPSAEPGCPLADSQLHCGSSDPTVTIAWDFDVTVDSDGDTVPENDTDATTCDASHPYDVGTHRASVTVTAPGGCSSAATVDVVVAATTAPGEVTGDRATRSGASYTLTWSPVAGAATYRVSRGHIGTWYDHATDVGRGACDTAGATTWTDPDDATDSINWYYLITAVEPCGLEGPTGQAFDGHVSTPRPARTPTATCP